MLKQRHEKVKAREMKNDNISEYNRDRGSKIFFRKWKFRAILYISVILLSVAFITKFVNILIFLNLINTLIYYLRYFLLFGLNFSIFNLFVL